VPALLFAYTLVEFLIRRVRRGPYARTGISRADVWIDAGVLCAVLLAATAGVQNPRLAAGCAATAVVYALADLPRRGSDRKNTSNRSLERFLGKQALVGICLWIACRWGSPIQMQPWFIDLGEQVLGARAMDWLNAGSTPALLAGAAYLCMIDGGTRIVRGILDKFPGLYRNAMDSLQSDHPGAAAEEGPENAGEWIGILERIVTLTFVFTNSFTAIAFALTAKSIARFRELENKSFAEYYLLGTVASVAVALLVGMAAKLLGPL